MPQVSKVDQITNAQVLRDEIQAGQNTKLRVYNLLLDIIESAVFFDMVKTTSGTSETDTMSQKSITDLFNSISIGDIITDDYANVAAMLADQANQGTGKWYRALDASADPDVTSGWAIYEKLGVSTGSLNDYYFILDQESLNISIQDATDLVKGIMKLYATTGSNTDGTMTQNAITTVLGNYVQGPGSALDEEVSVFDGTSGKLIKKGGVTINRVINSMSMGLTEGGQLSINADTTKFDVSAGKGLIVDNFTDPDVPVVTQVSWTAFTAVVPTYLATNTASHILIKSDGTIRQQSTYPTPQEHRDYIYLGQLGHTNLTNINAVINKPEVLISPTDQLRDLKDFIGLINSGNLVTANGANLKINKSEGYLLGSGINFHTDNKNPSIKYFAAQVAASLRLRTQTGNGSTGVTDIDPANYDVAGTITAIVGTKYTNQRVFLTIAGNIVVQYGQTLYNTMSQAVAAINRESFTIFTNVADNAFPIAVISVRNTATDLSDANQAQITFPTKFGELNAAAAGISISTLQNAYNNSTDPEILTDSTRGAVTIKRGSAADTDNVLEVKNGSDVEKFSVTGEGEVNVENLIELAEISSPSNPSANRLKVYAVDFNGKTRLEYKDADGNAIQFARDNIAVCKNVSGGTINKGQVVYISGGVGATDVPEVNLAKADSETTMPAMGVVYDTSIANNGFGYIIFSGKLKNFDTSGFTEGDIVYVSAATAGLLTATEPTSPNLPQQVGVIINSHASQGDMFVLITGVKSAVSGFTADYGSPDF